MELVSSGVLLDWTLELASLGVPLDWMSEVASSGVPLDWTSELASLVEALDWTSELALLGVPLDWTLELASSVEGLDWMSELASSGVPFGLDVIAGIIGRCIGLDVGTCYIFLMNSRVPLMDSRLDLSLQWIISLVSVMLYYFLHFALLEGVFHKKEKGLRN